MRTRFMLLGSLTLVAGLSGFYALKRPHVNDARPVHAAAPTNVESDRAQPSPASATALAPTYAATEETPAAPLGPPAVEPQEVLDTMSKTELAEDIAQMDDLLTKRDAINRLNAGTVSDAERAELGAIIERLALMKHQVAKIELGELESAVAEYEKGHAARVAAFVHKPKAKH